MKCSNCGHKFSQRTALCDNWKEPDKAHGCPHCGTFFVRQGRLNQKLASRLIWVVFFAGLFGQWVGRTITGGSQWGDGLLLWLALILLPMSVALYIYDARHWVVSPYRSADFDRQTEQP